MARLADASCSRCCSELREFASELRDLHASGASVEDLRETKAGMMETVNNVVMIHLGTPPTTFDWQYTDKNSKYHKMSGLTPQKFYEEICPIDVTTKVSLINECAHPRPLPAYLRWLLFGHHLKVVLRSPRNEYYQLYTVDKLNNMQGGLPVRYINLPVEALEEMSMKTLEKGEPVWFGCDCGKFMQRDAGIFDTELFDYDLIYGTAPVRFEPPHARAQSRCCAVLSAVFPMLSAACLRFD